VIRKGEFARYKWVMSYVLGIDLTNTEVTAAVSRWLGTIRPAPGSDRWSAPEAVPLHGTLAARDIVRRVGDTVPLIVNGEAWVAHTLLAAVIAWAAEQVHDWEGERAEHVVLSHPASWGAYRAELVQEALWKAGLPGVSLLPAPVVVTHHLAGTTLGVYQLEKEDFTTSVVRRAHDGSLAVAACIEAPEPFGGEDLECTETDRELRAMVAMTVDAMARVIRHAGTPPDAIALAGAFARVPAVQEQLEAEFALPITVLPHPPAAGAAVIASRMVSATFDSTPATAAAPAETDVAVPPRPPVQVSKLRLPRRRSAPRFVHARGFTFL
jgi:hypothetical protein